MIFDFQYQNILSKMLILTLYDPVLLLGSDGPSLSLSCNRYTRLGIPLQSLKLSFEVTEITRSYVVILLTPSCSGYKLLRWIDGAICRDMAWSYEAKLLNSSRKSHLQEKVVAATGWREDRGEGAITTGCVPEGWGGVAGVVPIILHLSLQWLNRLIFFWRCVQCNGSVRSASTVSNNSDLNISALMIRERCASSCTQLPVLNS